MTARPTPTCPLLAVAAATIGGAPRNEVELRGDTMRTIIAAALLATVALAQPVPSLQPLDVHPPTIRPAQVDPMQAQLNSRLRTDPHNCALLWAARVYCDEASPIWKRGAARRVILGKVARTSVRPTYYFPGNPAIDSLGGGWGNAWGLPRRLRRGDLAADTHTYPFGTVLVLAATGESGVVVDVGGAIDGNDIDICRTNVAEYRQDANRAAARVAWVVGRVGRKGAM